MFVSMVFAGVFMRVVMHQGQMGVFVVVTFAEQKKH
jgi:hypothetical protein